LHIPTLVITDLDSAESEGYHKTAQPTRCTNLISGNSSIKEWGILNNSLDYLLDLKENDKILQNDKVRLAYQTPITISLNEMSGEALSATFEETLVYGNLSEILNLNSDGIVQKVRDAATNIQIKDFFTEIYNAIHNSSNDKVSFALELMYMLDQVKTPQYIADGLSWLQEKLCCEDAGIIPRGMGNE
jgi:uncharacterized Fe-S center protein